MKTRSGLVVAMFNVEHRTDGWFWQTPDLDGTLDLDGWDGPYRNKQELAEVLARRLLQSLKMV